MQRADILIAAVLVVAAGGSALGVALYGDDRPRALSVSWSTQTVTVSTDRATHVASGETTATLPVRVFNVTSAAVTVSVQGSGPRLQQETVNVQITVPGVARPFSGTGTMAQGAGAATVSIPVAVALREAPTTDTITAVSPDAAVRALNASDGSALGRGIWTIRITFSAGAPGPLDTESHTVTVEAVVETYEALVLPRVPQISR